jgi:hypothetical protein
MITSAPVKKATAENTRLSRMNGAGSSTRAGG